ncbi:hypothetical protein CIB95_00165 [Lottiidibacillus patelloidae]|uniref:Putative amidase domain-containing protein n=1 Tax=Lottiidibacillus patelloidae TaxID=2670334 RepID=A0A263BYD6_9BACI|nr:hypothetical protein CIB95_00165 [Lottiidibacillus patelloidae]
MKSQIEKLIQNSQTEIIYDASNGNKPADEIERIQRWKDINKERKAEIVKVNARGKIYNSSKYGNYQTVDYLLQHEYLIKQKNNLYVEERSEKRRATFLNGVLQKDEAIAERGVEREHKKEKIERYKSNDSKRFYYNRMRAVQYAENWWNTYNSKYKKFENDCTNFISQCLHEGGAPIYGMPNRSKGWWYTNNNWSYSWSVANALMWFLASSEKGLQAKEVTSAEQLIPGDVICYDFDGDGNWQHNTIVVAKDTNNMPLVNAHSTNSRMRYWEYKDSHAWTPKVKYKFYHIIDDH